MTTDVPGNVPLNAGLGRRAPNALKACPFCGKHDTLMLTTFAELADPYGELGIDEGESRAVVCDASKPDGKGGCGATSGFKPTEADAVRNWNQRA